MPFIVLIIQSDIEGSQYVIFREEKQFSENSIYLRDEDADIIDMPRFKADGTSKHKTGIRESTKIGIMQMQRITREI